MRTFPIAAALLAVIPAIASAAERGQLVGTWRSDYGKVLVLRSDSRFDWHFADMLDRGTWSLRHGREIHLRSDTRDNRGHTIEDVARIDAFSGRTMSLTEFVTSRYPEKHGWRKIR